MLDHKIYTFLAVAETMSFTAAARRLGLTQPAVSQHIGKLEEHYGTKLFSSVGRSLRLTDSGRLLLQTARRQAADEERLSLRLSGETPRLRMGCTLSIADYYLAPGFAPGAGTPPRDLTVQVDNTARLLTMVEDGRLDCAFIEGFFDPALFTALPCRAVRFLPVVAADHPLAGRSVSLPHLFAYPLLIREEGSGTRAVLENYLFTRNVGLEQFSALWELGSFPLIKSLLPACQGITFLYEGVAAQELREGRFAPVYPEGMPLRKTFHLILRKGEEIPERGRRLLSIVNAAIPDLSAAESRQG